MTSHVNGLIFHGNLAAVTRLIYQDQTKLKNAVYTERVNEEWIKLAWGIHCKFTKISTICRTQDVNFRRPQEPFFCVRETLLLTLQTSGSLCIPEV